MDDLFIKLKITKDLSKETLKYLTRCHNNILNKDLKKIKNK